MELRLAKPDDTDVLARLHALAFAQGWTAKSLADLLAALGTFAFLAEENGTPLGFVLCRAAGGEAEILTLAVHPDARRHDFGRRLVEAAAGKAQTMGAGVLFLEVAVDNKAALGLYGLLGFAEAGRRKAYYAREAGPPADALTLKVELPLSRLGASSHLGKGAQLD